MSDNAELSPAASAAVQNWEAYQAGLKRESEWLREDWKKAMERANFVDAMELFALDIENRIGRASMKMSESAQSLVDAHERGIEETIELAKADVRGVALEAADVMGEAAAREVVAGMGEGVAALLARIDEHAKSMQETVLSMQDAAKKAADKMHAESLKVRRVPSRLVWMAIGAITYWGYTKYIDISKLQAIFNTVLQYSKGV